jgi:hypothetical protein
MKAAFIALVLAAALGACTKKDNPANQAAQDIKAMGEQRDKAQDAVKALEDSQQKARDATARNADDAAPEPDAAR